ncbi:MAG: energy transducer TonB, partial [Muribaculaceae bacterium]|nr:energy transducer TonB [Muribaculaceae bacterium]
IAADEQEAQKVLYTAETLPQFPGGETALFRWVADHMQYPQEAIDRNEQGRVVVKFIINEKGQVVEPEIVRSVSPSLDAEALRVVSSLPDFEPGKVNGKAVSVSYALPVNFSLKPDTTSTQQAAPAKKIDSTQQAASSEQSATIIKDGNVTVFVNGEANEYSVLNAINPVDIESMQIIKNDPDYPQGKIIVTLKQ